MKRSILLNLLGVSAIVLFAANDSYAQSSTPANPAMAKQDQAIQELLSEVHKLRVAMQHMSVNAYRGQIMVERLRLQQDQVGRLTRELNDLRNGIGEISSVVDRAGTGAKQPCRSQQAPGCA